MHANHTRQSQAQLWGMTFREGSIKLSSPPLSLAYLQCSHYLQWEGRAHLLIATHPFFPGTLIYIMTYLQADQKLGGYRAKGSTDHSQGME